jgi:hypothetical protein
VRPCYRYIEIVAKESATLNLDTVSARLDLLRTQLQIYRQMMTERIERNVSYRAFFEEFANPSSPEATRPTVRETEHGVVNILDEYAVPDPL